MYLGKNSETKGTFTTIIRKDGPKTLIQSSSRRNVNDLYLLLTDGLQTETGILREKGGV